MTRPIYETEADVSEQESIARRLEPFWHVKLKKLPRLHCMDHVGFSERSGNCVMWVEIKRRFIAFGCYPDIILSSRKVAEACKLNAITFLPCFFVVKFDDALAWTNMIAPWPSSKGGREDRGDEFDVEECARIPIEAFNKLR